MKIDRTKAGKTKLLKEIKELIEQAILPHVKSGFKFEKLRVSYSVGIELEITTKKHSFDFTFIPNLGISALSHTCSAREIGCMEDYEYESYEVIFSEANCLDIADTKGPGSEFTPEEIKLLDQAYAKGLELILSEQSYNGYELGGLYIMNMFRNTFYYRVAQIWQEEGKLVAPIIEWDPKRTESEMFSAIFKYEK